MVSYELKPASHYPNSHNQQKSFMGRNLGLMIAVSLFVAGWMLVYTFTMYHPKYSSKATVIIKDSAITNRFIEPEQYYAMQTTTSTSSNPVLNAMSLLKSQAVSDDLWRYFSEQHPEELKRLKIKSQKEWNSYYQDGSAFIKAKNQQGTDLISIQFAWGNPIIAQEGLAVVVKAFQEASRDLNKEEQISRTIFLSRQVGDIEAKLAAIRHQKSQYQSQNKTVSINHERDGLATSRMELENKLAQLQAQAQGKENVVNRYRQLLHMSPEQALRASAVGQDSSMGKLQDELYRLEQLHSQLRASLTDSNPKVRELQAQIEQVKANIAAEKSRVASVFGEAGEDEAVVADSTRNTLIGDMVKAQGEARDLQAQVRVLRQRLSQVNGDIAQFPNTAVGVANLEQQETTLSTALDHLRQKVMEGKMKEAQTLSNVFIVDSPRLPEHPSFPNRNHLIVLSIVMGLASGVAAAFIKEQIFPVKQSESLPEADYDETNEFQDEQEETLVATRREARKPGRPLVSNYVNWAAITSNQANQVNQSPSHPLITNQPDAEGADVIETEQVGSLFDSLMAEPKSTAQPLARSIPATPTQPGSHLEHIHPLPKHYASKPEMAQPTHTSPVSLAEAQPTTAINTPEISTTPGHYSDADLLPPSLDEISATESPVIPRLEILPTQTQPQAETPADLPLTANYAEETFSHEPVSEPQIGYIPVFHASPANGQVEEQPPMSVPVETHVEPEVEVLAETPASDSTPTPGLSAASHLISALDFAEEPESVTPEPITTLEADPATQLYETHAKTMPLPRRRGGFIPSFLLGDTPIDVEAFDSSFDDTTDDIKQPYKLIPRKKLRQQASQPDLQADAQPTFSDVEDAPTRESQMQTPMSNMESDDQLHQEWYGNGEPLPPTPPAPDFPPMPDFIPEEFLRHSRKPVLSKLFGRKKVDQSELLLGTSFSARKR